MTRFPWLDLSHPDRRRKPALRMVSVPRARRSRKRRSARQVRCRSPRNDAARRSTIYVLYRNMTTIESFRRLSDEQLVEETLRLATRECEATARLVAALVELDSRRLYLAQGYSSLFAYCTRGLHFSEHAPQALIERARQKTTKEVELLVAGLQPKPPVPSTIRTLPVVQSERETSEPHLAASVVAQPPAVPDTPPPSRRPLVKPLSAQSYRLQITMSVGTHDKLRRAQALMRHRVPTGDPATICDHALDALIREVEKGKCARVERPRAGRASVDGSRHIPASVKREVWKRDEARCVFEGANGQRCAETDFLEFHHVVPDARRGRRRLNTSSSGAARTMRTKRRETSGYS